MAYEKECDFVLGIFAKRITTTMPIYRHEISTALEQSFNHTSAKDILAVTDILSILIAENLIREESNDGFVLLNKGRAFYHTDSFVQRAERWELEQETKKNELRKLRWEVSKMRVTYRLALWGFIVAVVTLLIGEELRGLLSRIAEWLQSV